MRPTTCTELAEDGDAGLTSNMVIWPLPALDAVLTKTVSWPPGTHVPPGLTICQELV